MKVPTVKEALLKKRRDMTDLDKFVVEFVNTRRMSNCLQKVIDYVISQL